VFRYGGNNLALDNVKVCRIARRKVQLSLFRTALFESQALRCGFAVRPDELVIHWSKSVDPRREEPGQTFEWIHNTPPGQKTPSLKFNDLGALAPAPSAFLYAA
jgi:hypothetical protein